MNRRQFLVNSMYSTLALTFAACGKKPANEAHTMHTPNTTAAASNVFDMSRLRSGEPLRTPAILSMSDAVLNIQPTQHSWLRDGRATDIWAYQSPTGGTMLDVKVGEQVRITVNNHLPESTTVHWHGVDVPADQDGHPHHPIEPKQSRVYEFTPPDAGTYWYHPHPHGRTAMQVARGLAAPIIVRDPNDPITQLGIPEQVLMFTTLQLDANAQIAPQTMDEQMNGREGNVVLVNGQYQPIWTVAPNSMHRLRLINASNARYLRLSLGGVLMTVVGTDGGLLEQPLPPQSEILLAPAERLEVCVNFQNAVTLNAQPYDKGWMDGGMGGQKPALKPIELLHIQVSGEVATPPNLPKKLRTITPLGKAIVTRQLLLTENMQMSMAGGVHSMTMEFMINNQMYDMNRTDFTSRVDQVELWEIVNQTDMDHPFHIHGSHFQIVSTEENGKATPYPYLAWKDTVNTRAGQTIRLKIAQKQVGLRMFHCHILEHEDLGMMGQYEVQA